MKRHLIAAMLFLLPFTALSASKAPAEVNLSIGINLPLQGVAAFSSPEVMVIPGTYVYFIPDAREEIFFYRGYWYRPYKNGWYRSDNHNNGWVLISIEMIPAAVRKVPEGYRMVPPGHRKIPYGQLKKNWKSWEKERHWDEARDHHDRKDHGHGKHNGKHGKGK